MVVFQRTPTSLRMPPERQLVRQAVSKGRRAYVLVNNRSEGNAPLTVQALEENSTRMLGSVPSVRPVRPRTLTSERGEERDEWPG